MSRSVKPELVTTLGAWAGRWGKVTNLGFDPESREPTVYAADGSKTRVSSFPWKREGDTMTILTAPQQFGEGAVKVARARYDGIQKKRGELVAAIEDPLSKATARLLEEWRQYHATPVAGRAALRPQIMLAERAVRDLEASLGRYRYLERRHRELESKFGKFETAYVPPIPTGRRGISLTEATEGTPA